MAEENKKQYHGVIKTVKVFLVLFFIIISSAFAGELCVDEGHERILEKVIERYSDNSGLSVNYRREIITRSMAMLGEDMRGDLAEGIFYFMPPHFLRMEQKSPVSEYIYADDEGMYWYNPEEKTAYQFPLGREQEMLNELFTGMINIQTDFSVSLDSTRNNESYILKLAPVREWEELDHIRVSVDRDRYHIISVEIINLIGSITRFTLDEFESRDDLKECFFRFDVPDDVNVLKEY